jgi:hypothetical protein
MSGSTSYTRASNRAQALLRAVKPTSSESEYLSGYHDRKLLVHNHRALLFFCQDFHHLIVGTINALFVWDDRTDIMQVTRLFRLSWITIESRGQLLGFAGHSRTMFRCFLMFKSVQKTRYIFCDFPNSFEAIGD